MNDRLKFWVVLGFQFVVFVGFTLFVYRGGFNDGFFAGMEEICGKERVVLSKDILTGVETLRCRLDSDFKSNKPSYNISGFLKYQEGLE